MSSQSLPPVAVDRIVAVPLALADEPGDFVSFTGLPAGEEHFAVRFGAPDPACALVRIHSECITGDVFGSRRCDCGDQLREAIALLAREGGYLLYLRQEGRGIGLYAKLHAYALQQEGLDTYQANLALGHPADARDFGVAATMLRALGVSGVVLLTNNPAKAQALEEAGLAVRHRPTGVFVNAHNQRYLQAKQDDGGHRLDLPAMLPSSG